jgi:hypothetical protein
LQQTLEGRSLQGSTGIAAIVVEGGKGAPALLALADDEGLTGFPLSVQGVEGLFETPSSDDLRV